MPCSLYRQYGISYLNCSRLNIEHFDQLRQATNIPLVLHGGSGIKKESLLQAVKHGIAKINIGTTIRQVNESLYEKSTTKAQENVYNATVALVTEGLEVSGSASVLFAK